MTLLIGILYILLPLVFTGMYFFGYLYTAYELLEPYNISIVAGAAAYVVFMSQFLLSARLRFLEQRVPQDQLLALHGSSGVAAVSLVSIHGILKYVLVIRTGGTNVQSLLGIGALVVSAFLTPLALLVLRGQRRKRGAGKDRSPRYEANRIAHNLFALAGLAAVIHVYTASSTWSPALKIFTIGWGVLSLGAYIYHKMIRPRFRKDLILKEVDELAPGIHRYAFDGNITRFSGQFFYTRFASAPPGPEDHPFTVSSPSESDLEITVRNSGDFTAAMPGAAPGSPVSLDGPFGHFHPGSIPEGRPLVFLAAGIGITPVLSLARDAELRRRFPMTVLWCIRTPADEPVGGPLLSLHESGELDFRIIYTREAPEGQVFGRLDLEGLRTYTERLTTASWFICGPSGFGATMRRYLRKLGVPGRRIREERFSW